MKNTNKESIVFFLFLCMSTTMFGQFVQERDISNRPYLTYQEMQISVIDAQSKKPVVTDIKIKGLHPRNIITFESISDTLFEIKNYRLYTVSCVEKGYAFYIKKFWPDEQLIHLQKISLQPLAVGIKTDIRDITFLGNKTEIFHKSKPALNELIEWLQLNPSVKIAVIGHVNGPDQSRTKNFYKKASLERAQVVVNYLIEDGISADRLEPRGAGNSEMIYPDPHTEWQNEANRRVEIEIIDL